MRHIFPLVALFAAGCVPGPAAPPRPWYEAPGVPGAPVPVGDGEPLAAAWADGTYDARYAGRWVESPGRWGAGEAVRLGPEGGYGSAAGPVVRHGRSAASRVEVAFVFARPADHPGPVVATAAEQRVFLSEAGAEAHVARFPVVRVVGYVLPAADCPRIGLAPGPTVVGCRVVR